MNETYKLHSHPLPKHYTPWGRMWSRPIISDVFVYHLEVGAGFPIRFPTTFVTARCIHLMSLLCASAGCSNNYILRPKNTLLARMGPVLVLYTLSLHTKGANTLVSEPESSNRFGWELTTMCCFDWSVFVFCVHLLLQQQPLTSNLTRFFLCLCICHACKCRSIGKGTEGW